MNDRDDFGSFLAGFAIGGLVGAVISLLFAPQSGNETRTVIREKAYEIRDKAEDAYDDTYAKAEAAASQARIKLEELAHLSKDKASELVDKGQVVLEEQREKLSDALSKAKKQVEQS